MRGFGLRVDVFLEKIQNSASDVMEFWGFCVFKLCGAAKPWTLAGVGLVKRPRFGLGDSLNVDFFRGVLGCSPGRSGMNGASGLTRPQWQGAERILGGKTAGTGWPCRLLGP